MFDNPNCMQKLSRTFCGLWVFVMFVACASACGQGSPSTEKIPAIDAGLGSCALDLTIMTQDGKPAAAADVKVHIVYGFGGFHKLDLEAGANSDGKVRFTGLPSKLRRPPLEFQASKGGMAGVATYDPGKECQAKHEIVLEKPKEEAH